MNHAKQPSSFASGDAMQDPKNVDLAVAEAMEEYLHLLETQTSFDRDAFLAKHRQISDQLSDAMESLDFVTRLTAQSIANKSPEASPSDDNAGAPESPEALGDFRIIREIGRGGMGVVYEAEQRSLRRNVALKVLPFASLLDPRQIDRFHNETRAAAMLRHPNIVSVHSVGCERGVHYYAMDLINGCSLAELVSRLKPQDNVSASHSVDSQLGPDKDNTESSPTSQQTFDTVPIAQLSTEHSSDLRSYLRSIAMIGGQAAEALHFAHQSGVIHRDIKPSNLILDRTGQVHIADFGLARVEANDSITLTGDLVGTLRYMSPEQVEGHNADERSDVYSLGATLFELATLQPPFDGANRGQIMRAIVESPIPSVHKFRPEIPRDLATILDKSLQKNPTDRYRNAKELADDLRRFQEHRSIKARPTNNLRRLRYFTRRNPALVVSIAVAFVLMALLASVSAALAWNFSQQAGTEAARVAEAAIDARLQRIRRYSNEMRLGKQLADERRLVELQELLLRWVPAEGEEDLRSFEWGHLWQNCIDPAVIHTYDHELPTYQVTFLNDHEIATAGFPNRAKIWSLSEGKREKPRMYLRMSGTVMETLLYDKQRNRVFATNGNDQLCVWDAETGKRLKQMRLGVATFKGLVSNADSLDLSKDGRFLLVGSGSWEAGAIRVIDLTSDETSLIKDQSSRSLAVFGPEGRIIAVNATSDKIQILDPASCELIRSLPTNANGAWEMAISPDKSLIAFGFMKKHGEHFTHSIELWETTNWSRIWSMATESRVVSINFSDDGKMLAFGDKIGHVQIAHIDSNGSIEELSPHRRLHSQNVFDLEFSPNKKMLATASGDGFVTVWEVNKLLKPAAAHVDFSASRYRSTGSCFADDQHTIATTYRTKGVVFWDGETGNDLGIQFDAAEMTRWLHVETAPSVGLIGVSFSYWPILEKSDPRRSEVVIWDFNKQEVRFRVDDLPPIGKSVTSCSFSPDGRYFAICSHNEGIIILDLVSESVMGSLPDIPGKTLRFSRDSTLLAIGTTNGMAHMVSVPEFSVIEKFRLDDRLVDSIDISPDGRYITGVGFDRRVNIYDRELGKSRDFIEKLGGFPTVVRFSPDGDRILTASLDGKVGLWIVETGDQVMSWNIPASQWPNGSFSPSGDAIVVGGMGFAKVIHGRIDEQLRRISASALRSQACQNVSHEEW